MPKRETIEIVLKYRAFYSSPVKQTKKPLMDGTPAKTRVPSFINNKEVMR